MITSRRFWKYWKLVLFHIKQFFTFNDIRLLEITLGIGVEDKTTLTLYDETSVAALRFIRWRAAATASLRSPTLTSGSAIMSKLLKEVVQLFRAKDKVNSGDKFLTVKAQTSNSKNTDF